MVENVAKIYEMKISIILFLFAVWLAFFFQGAEILGLFTPKQIIGTIYLVSGIALITYALYLACTLIRSRESRKEYSKS